MQTMLETEKNIALPEVTSFSPQTDKKFEPDKHLPLLVDYLNQKVLNRHSTCLRGGACEPFYRAPKILAGAHGQDQWLPAMIEFREDYPRSALHELAHWCIAGSNRRKQDDYGYWYVPDGRTKAQQKMFFQVEIKPQALEQIFCEILGIPFEASVDNLGGEAPTKEETEAFTAALQAQRLIWRKTGLPRRAQAICTALNEFAALYLKSDKAAQQGPP